MSYVEANIQQIFDKLKHVDTRSICHDLGFCSSSSSSSSSSSTDAFKTPANLLPVGLLGGADRPILKIQDTAKTVEAVEKDKSTDYFKATADLLPIGLLGGKDRPILKIQEAVEVPKNDDGVIRLKKKVRRELKGGGGRRWDGIAVEWDSQQIFILQLIEKAFVWFLDWIFQRRLVIFVHYGTSESSEGRRLSSSSFSMLCVSLSANMVAKGLPKVKHVKALQRSNFLHQFHFSPACQDAASRSPSS